jgi:hypothetical protein
MDIEKIRALRLAHPFKPFALILDNGRKLVIDKPFGLAISPTKQFVLVPTLPEGAVWFSPDQVREAVMLRGNAMVSI